MAEIVNCKHGSAAPDSVLLNLHVNQGGPQRHKCAVCAYEKGFRQEELGLFGDSEDESCQSGSTMSRPLLDEIPESQGTIGRHKCCICAFREGHEAAKSGRRFGGFSASAARVVDVPIEKNQAETFTTCSKAAILQSKRVEARLVKAFCAFLEQRNAVQVVRKKILPIKAEAALYTDLYVERYNLLIEAKGSVKREEFRMAIGQLLDYRRFLMEPYCAVLLPRRPNDDLMSLASGLEIGVIWLQGRDFFSTFNMGERQ